MPTFDANGTDVPWLLATAWDEEKKQKHPGEETGLLQRQYRGE